MFNWFSGKPRSTLPETTPLESQRSKQIDQLKAYHHGVSEIQRDIEYRVNTYIQGNTFSFYVPLPPRFPADKPLVKVSPEVQHPWVDDMMMVTGSPCLNNFSVHSDLGKAVKEIAEEFERNPPIISPQRANNGSNRYTPYPASSNVRNQSSYPGYPAYTSPSSAYISQVNMPTLPPSYSTSTTYQSAVVTRSTAPTEVINDGIYKFPDMYGSFTQLHDLSVHELQTILNNEEKLEEVVSKSPQITQLYQDMESMTQNNEQLAKENLMKKPIFEEKKRCILEKYDHLNELKDQFGVNSSRQEELLSGYKAQAIQDRLQIAASQADEESEIIAEQFLEGKISLEEFKKRYTSIRTLSHLRKAKEEKLHTVLLQYRIS